MKRLTNYNFDEIVYDDDGNENVTIKRFNEHNNGSAREL